MLTGARLYSLRRNWLDNEVVKSNKQKWCYGYYKFYYIKLKNLSIPNQQQQKKKLNIHLLGCWNLSIIFIIMPILRGASL